MLQNHYYQPMWTLIGAGAKPLTACRLPMSEVIPGSVDHIHGKIAQIDPENDNIYMEDGSHVSEFYYVNFTLV